MFGPVSQQVLHGNNNQACGGAQRRTQYLPVHVIENFSPQVFHDMMPQFVAGFWSVEPPVGGVVVVGAGVKYAVGILDIVGQVGIVAVAVKGELENFHARKAASVVS